MVKKREMEGRRKTERERGQRKRKGKCQLKTETNGGDELCIGVGEG